MREDVTGYFLIRILSTALRRDATTSEDDEDVTTEISTIKTMQIITTQFLNAHDKSSGLDALMIPTATESNLSESNENHALTGSS